MGFYAQLLLRSVCEWPRRSCSPSLRALRVSIILSLALTNFAHVVGTASADTQISRQWSALQATSTPTPGSTRLKDITFEDGSLTDPTTGADSVIGGVTLTTTTPLKGLYSASIPNVSSAYLREDFTAADEVYVSLYLKMNVLPSSDVRLVMFSDQGTTVGSIVLRATGALRLKNGSTAIGSDSAPISAGTLYRIGLHQKAGTGSDAVLEGYVATGDTAFGAPFASTTSGAWTTQADRLQFGTTTSVAWDGLMDDIRLDTGAMPGPSGSSATPTPTATATATPGATPTPTTAGSTRLKDITFEDGSLTHPTSGADSVTGEVALDGNTLLKGIYSADFPSVSGAYLTENFTGIDDAYVSLYLKVNALPSSNVQIVYFSNAGTTVGNLQLLTSGALRLRNDTTTIGADSAPLTVGTLYRIGLYQKTGTGSNALLEAYLAVGDAAFGAPFASTTSGTWTSQADRLRVGVTGTTAIDLTVDDIRLDAGAMPGPSGPSATPRPQPLPPQPRPAQRPLPLLLRLCCPRTPRCRPDILFPLPRQRQQCHPKA